MSHFILASVGTHGDVFPFLALGSALRSRGSRVTVAVNEPYRQLAKDYGLEFAPLVSNEQTIEFLSDPDLWHPIKSALVGARWGCRYLRDQYELLSQLAGDDDAVLVASPGVISARLVQEKFARPLATVYYTPWMIPSCTDPPAMTGGWTLPRWAPRPCGHLYWRLVDFVAAIILGHQLNQLRSSLELEPVRRIFQWWISPDMAIGLFPAWYATPQPDWPAQLRISGFPMFDGEKKGKLDAELIRFCQQGDPPIAFTFGTGMLHAAKLFRLAIESCREMGTRGLLLTRYREQLPDALPPSVRHFEYVPLSELLPHCSMIVHHGGVGTVAKALATGTPQLIIPHAWDQLDNARRVVQLGVGAMLKRSQVNGPRMRTALGNLLDEGTMQRCRSVAAWVDVEDPMTQAARWIEELGRPASDV